MNAIQDHYPSEFAHCYGCGPANPHGHHLKSFIDGDRTHALFLPDAKYSGGYPGNVYGGMLASLLDCHGTASAAAFAYKAQGRTMGDGGRPLRFVTGSLKIDFKLPTPIGSELMIEGVLRSLDARKAVIDLTLGANGKICVIAEMIAVQLVAKPPIAAG
ncbi:MAG: hotdog fold domain-containing protein [Rubrivivax sp.]